MHVLRTLRGVFSTDRVVLYECRRCGTTVDAGSEQCPRCGVDSIARYEIR
jgi:rubrerythrin